MTLNEQQLCHDSHVTLLGRRLPDDPLRLFWTGSGLAVRMNAREVSAVIEADWTEHSPWMAVLVDGAPVARFALRRGTHTYALLTGLDESFAHRVTLMRDTQPIEDDAREVVRVRSLTVEGALLQDEPRRHIELIGDSLTSGEGLAGPVSGAEWRTVWMHGGLTWAARVCAMLNADGEWVSQSGWGILTDWNQDRRHTLPAIYDGVCAVQPDGRVPYDFATHPVDAVVVHLGTNDMSALNALPAEDQPTREAEIAAAVRAFCETLRDLRPGTPVLWTCGMCGDRLNALLARTVDLAAEALAPARFAFLPLPACPSDQLGSRGHPGPISHLDCAALIAGQLTSMLNP